MHAVIKIMWSLSQSIWLYGVHLCCDDVNDKRLMWWDEVRWMARHCDVALGYYWLDNTSEESSALGDPGSLSYDDTNGWMLGADRRWLGKLNIFGLQLTQVSETAENKTEDKGGLPPFLDLSKCIFFCFHLAKFCQGRKQDWSRKLLSQ